MQNIIANLIGLDFFFAMKSCEFSAVLGERKTKIITLGGVRFFTKDNVTIPHSSREIFRAYGVSITFVIQKNEHLWDIVSQEYTTDRQLNPVLLSASIVWRIRGIPGTDNETPICCYHENYTIKHVHQSQVLDYLRGTAAAIGKARLGFDPSEIGNKSIRSGACMAWFLANHPVEHIKMMGRWDSEAWLDYIRTQVMEFCKGMSSSMLRYEFYHDLPSFAASPLNHSMAPPASQFNRDLSMSSSFAYQY